MQSGALGSSLALELSMLIHKLWFCGSSVSLRPTTFFLESKGRLRIKVYAVLFWCNFDILLSFFFQYG